MSLLPDYNLLFNHSQFQHQIAETDQPLPLFKQTLHQGDQLLQAWFQEKKPIEQLVQARTWFIDQLLIEAWNLLVKQHSELTLIAVGGYGRQELLPASDIDLLILIGDIDDHALEPILTPFLYLLMDMGLTVGHSVRSIEDCVKESSDLTVITNLIEARLLRGSETLFHQLNLAIGIDKLWPSDEFFAAKQTEQTSRHQRFHDTAYKLEPNIKESPGGLRDIQMIGWVAKRHFNANTLYDLVTHQFLTAKEYNTLLTGQHFLWQIRFSLHTLGKGRCEDRLLFDYQLQLANEFGYDDQTNNLAVEQFMQHYFRTVQQLSRLNEMLLQLFQEAILHPKTTIPIKINARFQNINGFIEVSHPNVFQQTPFALLEIFLLLQQNSQLIGVRATTIRLIRDHLHLINDDYRNDIRNRSLFMEILRQPQGVTHELRRMNRYGILAAYIPEFANIVGRMQYDLFHIYTVDEHTLFVVRNVRRLMVSEFNHELPRCSEIAQNIPKPELLYLAALFHDIAKGRGGDHAELGEQDAKAFCQRHHISTHDTKLVTWLVRHHLIMSTTSQRKDIDDLAEIFHFAKLVDNRTKLDYLYLLTVSDIRATNPELWDSWKATLLWKLYRSTRHVLGQGLVNIPNRTHQINETCHQVHDLLAGNLTHNQIDRALADVTDDYLFRCPANEIAWHISAIEQHNSQQPLVGVRQDDDYGNTEIFVYSAENETLRNHRFALITAVIDQLGLTIADAKLMQFKPHYILDAYVVTHDITAEETPSVSNKALLEQLYLCLAKPNILPDIVNRWALRTTEHFSVPANITYQQDKDYTRVEVQATDRPGLLAQVARSLLDCNIQVISAKVTTFGALAEDIFYLTDQQNNPLNDDIFDCLKTRLEKSL